MDKLVQLLTSIAAYTPNEADLKPAALSALFADMKTKNAAVLAASTPLNNLRIARNALLYTPGTGLVDIAHDTKKYVKSIYGPTSAQYKQVSPIKFTKIKI